MLDVRFLNLHVGRWGLRGVWWSEEERGREKEGEGWSLRLQLEDRAPPVAGLLPGWKLNLHLLC